MIQIFGTLKNFDVKTAQRWFAERRISVQFVDLKEKEMSRGEFESVLNGFMRMPNVDVYVTVSATRKTWGEESCLILMNISTEEKQCDLTGYEVFTLAGTLTVDERGVTQTGNQLILPPYAVAVLCN